MLDWVKAKWRHLLQRRRSTRDIHPDSFKKLAKELQELARVAEHLLPSDQKFYTRIKRIQTEMEQLERLTSKPEFRRLPPQKRLQLRQSLIQSRKQLQESVQTAPSPTSTLQ